MDGRMRLSVAAAVCVALLGAEARVKFIAHGWDTMDMPPETVAANAGALEKCGIDGLTLALPRRKQADGSTADAFRLGGRTPVRYETYADVVPHFREIVKHEGLKDSFLLCGMHGIHCKWADDATWGVFARNMRVMARLAKEGGLKGLFIDNEDYRRLRLFTHKPEECDYETACRLARQRGREVFGGVFEEFPEAVVMPFWLLMKVQSYADGADPVTAMKAGGGLWPSFVNGMLDALPPTGRLVDGNEHAYHYDYSRGDFAEGAARQLVTLLPLVANENRLKYRGQTDVGFGFYLDGYTVTNVNMFYKAPVNGSRLEHLRLDLTDASRYADEYIWLYGECFSWVKWRSAPKARMRRYRIDKTWEEAHPGFAAVLRDVKNPAAGLTERILSARAKGAAVNRFHEALAKERHWSRDKRGSYTVEPNAGIGGSITITGVRSGCAELPVAVAGGETWVVDMYMSGSSGDRPSLCYRDKKGKTHWELGTVWCEWRGSDTVGRRQASAIVRIPDEMTTLLLMLNARQRPDESCTFTDIMMAKCEE